MLQPVAFDTETALIRPALLAPPPACLTWQRRGLEARISTEIRPYVQGWLAAPDALLVGHNVAYDLAVVGAAYPELLPAIFRAYDEDRVTDTMLRQQLLDIAAGAYRGRLTSSGFWIKHTYDLEALAKRNAGMVLQKDAWRLSYGSFLGIPLAQWPSRAAEVQAAAKSRLAAVEAALAAVAGVTLEGDSELEDDDDAAPATLVIEPPRTKAAKKALEKERDDLRSMVASDPGQCIVYPLDDARATLAVFEAQEKHASYLADQYRQARGAFWLHLSSAWGLRTDPEGVATLRRETQAALDEVETELKSAGLVRATGCDEGKRDTKAAKRRMVEVCDRDGLTLRMTKAHTDGDDETVAEYTARGRKARCKLLDGTPLDDGSPACQEHVSLDADACAASEDPILVDYAEFSTLKKVLSNDVVALESGTIWPVHTRYGIAETGRTTSCIAKGEPIQTPCNRRMYPQGKPIENIRAGDCVYSYSPDGKLHLQRVLWAGCTGHKPLVKITWIGQGHHHKGAVRLTEDHRVMLLGGAWIEARNLRPGMRLTALSCRAKGNYQHLYARGGIDHREHVFAHASVHGEHKVVHHIDHDSFNNDLTNLQGMSSAEHALRHANEASEETHAKRTAVLLRPDVQAKARAACLRGADHPMWKEVPRSTLLRWAALCQGKIRKIMDLTGSDFNVLERKYRIAGIDLVALRQRYNGAGEYITRAMVRAAAQLQGNARHKALRVSHGRFRELLDIHGLSGNHEVVSVEQDGEDWVFDLEVEHTHSFIAGEICVHNSKPNIQNLRRKAGIREAFVPRPRKVFMQADYPQLELYTLAQCCVSWFGFSKLADTLNAGRDPHLSVAAQILGISYEEAAKNKKRADVDNARQTAKVANFGFPGGLGIEKLILFARKTYGVVFDADPDKAAAKAKALKEQWLATFPEMQRHFGRVNALCNTPNGLASVETLWTKRTRGGATYCAACNNGFQALGVDCAKEAGWRITRAMYVRQEGPSSVLFGSRIVAFVHDEFIGETDDAPTAHDCAYEMARLMVEGANIYLPDVQIKLEKMEPLLMRRWSKKAEPTFDANGRLVPWEGKKQ